MVNLPNIKIIGLTGMSGAGKSTVCGVFGRMGFTVIDCDGIAREVALDRGFLNELKDRFPVSVLKSDGSLDRSATARAIFTDSSKRRLYDQIIFPYIVFRIIGEIRSAEGDVLLDAPTLFESGLEMICDATVGVTASTEICVQRIMERDKLSRERAAERLSAQRDAVFFEEHCDHIIENNGTAEELSERAENIADKLKGRSR